MNYNLDIYSTTLKDTKQFFDKNQKLEFGNPLHILYRDILNLYDEIEKFLEYYSDVNISDFSPKYYSDMVNVFDLKDILRELEEWEQNGMEWFEWVDLYYEERDDLEPYGDDDY